MTTASRLIIGITGASGAIYGIRLLQALRELPVESHLVISRSAEMTIGYETNYKLRDVQQLADEIHSFPDVGAAISSGSFRTDGMIIAPCSVRSMSEIATGVTSNLLTRAADVVLKERKKLVLMLRETPLHSGHLRSLLSLSEMGAIIAPPVPAFYHNPQTLDDIINQSVGRVLDIFDLESPLVSRWGERRPDGSPSSRRG